MGADDPATPDPSDLNLAARDAWDANAAFWDAHQGEGDLFQRDLIRPATERLLELQPGEAVLDLGCGNGAFSRRLAELGARVLGVDFSAALLALARQCTTRHADRIEYRQVDLADPAQLLTLGAQRFDAAVATMVFMDLSVLEPLARSLPTLLGPRGRLVFSVSHPCFNTTGCSLTLEEEDRDGELILTRAVKVTRYIRPTVRRGLAVRGQPVPHPYFERPLSLLLGTFFQVGFALDALEEPTFPESDPDGDALRWERFVEIPPVLVARLRPAPPRIATRDGSSDDPPRAGAPA